MLKPVNPTTGRPLPEVATDPDADVERKLQRAADAWEDWRRRPFSARAEVMRAVASHMREHVETLAPVMTLEMGKPIREARGEVLKAALAADHYAEHAGAYLADERIASDAARSWVQYLPLGPVLGILPWNAPFWLAFRFCAPALMAGNTCVMKHDPHTPLSAQAIAGVFEAVGAPGGLLENVVVENPRVEGLIRDPRIQAVSFTGSDRAGALVAATAASEIKRAVLELGGSDPAIVLADADLERAAEVIALSRIINAGQSCIAAKRIIVEDRVHDTFVEHLRGCLGRLTVGDPFSESTDVGPIARADLREVLHHQVRTTLDEGASCAMGGVIPDGEGFYYPVTLLTGVEEGMCATREETFGPVAVVLRVPDASEALRVANATPWGLGASVWTSAERGVAMAREIVAGQVSVNGIVKTDPRLPSGGVRRSGYGRELGPHGIREFVNVQQVWVG